MTQQSVYVVTHITQVLASSRSEAKENTNVSALGPSRVLSSVVTQVYKKQLDEDQKRALITLTPEEMDLIEPIGSG